MEVNEQQNGGNADQQHQHIEPGQEGSNNSAQEQNLKGMNGPSVGQQDLDKETGIDSKSEPQHNGPDDVDINEDDSSGSKHLNRSGG